MPTNPPAKGRAPALAQNVPPQPDTPSALQVPAKVAARMAGVSVASWWRLHALKKVPTPVRLGGRVLWRVEELREWIEHGCPDDRAWQALKAAGRK